MGLLSDSQWGFRRKRSISLVLIATIHKWMQLIKDGSSVGAVFFNLHKAFDSVPHSLLLNKLEQYDLPPSIVDWLACYLTGRLQLMGYNHLLQGWSSSRLDSRTFIVYNLYRSSMWYSVTSTIIVYADDMLLYRPVDSDADLQEFQDDVY